MDDEEIPTDDEIEEHFDKYQAIIHDGRVEKNPLRIILIPVIIVYSLYMIFSAILDGDTDVDAVRISYFRLTLGLFFLSMVIIYIMYLRLSDKFDILMSMYRKNKLE